MMIIDAATTQIDKFIETDICVIGAGVAGVTFVREFIDSDTQIVLLESGGLEFAQTDQDLNTGKNTGLPYFSLDASRARAFGGSSNRWHIDVNQSYKGVRIHGLDEIDFEKKAWIPYSGWPFQKKELDPYYETAHEIFKIGPYSYRAEDWTEPDEQHSLPFENGNVETTVFQFARWDLFFNEYRMEVERAGNISAYTDATVLKINTNDNATKTTSVDATTSDGRIFTIRAQFFVVALGGLETPRLLMLSNDHIEKGLGNQNDLVGRFFMEHIHHSRNSGKFFPSNPGQFRKPGIYDLKVRKGVPVLGNLKLSEEMIRKNRLLNFTVRISGDNEWRIERLGEGVQSLKCILSNIKKGKLPEHFSRHIINTIKNTDVMAYAAARKLSGGEKDKWNKFGGSYSGISLGIMSEQIPDPESRIRLGRDKDRFGQPKIELTWKLSPVDIDSMRKSLEIIDEEMRKAGIGHLEFQFNGSSPPPEIQGGYHHMGTTRMHDNPEFGVVDRNCRVHGNENLFIAGSSVFPTGGYANPTLTIVALTLRLAGHLKKLRSSKMLNYNVP